MFERLTTGLKTLFAPQWGNFWPQDQPPYSNQTGLPPINVTAETAFGLPAYLAAVHVLSEDIAKLPLKVYRRLPNGGKEPAADHSLYRVLHDVANPEMTSFVWREVSMAHLVTWGNCYSEIVRNQLGEVVELWPLRPDRVRVMRDDTTDVKFYRVFDRAGAFTDLRPRDVFHVPGLGYDGNVGYSTITMMSKAIGLGLAAQRYAEGFWNNNARPGVVLTVPKDVTLSDERADKLKAQFAASHEGLTNAQRTALLRDGITIADFGIPPEDAQMIETREFQVGEIARALRIPPHKIGDLSKATFSNIEQQALEYVQDALSGWAGRWEAQISKDLFRPDEQDHFAEFLFDALLRGDSTTRANALWIQRQAGVLNADEWREIENRNPLPNGIGQAYWEPLNNTTAGRASPEKLAVQVRAGLLTIDEARNVMDLPPMQWSETPTTDELVAQVKGGLLTLDEARALMKLPPIEWADGPTPEEMASVLEQLKAGVLTHEEVRALLNRPPMQWPDELGPDEVASVIEQVKAGLLTENEARDLMKRTPLEYADGPSPDEVTSLVTQVHEGLLTIDEARAQLGRQPVEWPEDFTEKVAQAGELIKAGFDPVDVMRVLGLPQIRHLGLPPVTVQKLADAEGGPETPINPDVLPRTDMNDSTAAGSETSSDVAPVEAPL